MIDHQPSVRLHPDRGSLGAAAAADIAEAIGRAVRRTGAARIVFAAAPSQESTLRRLAERTDVDWARVTAFHMDEYVGLPADAPERFGNWLCRTLFDSVPLADIHLLNPGDDPHDEIARYAALLGAEPIDVVCCGIGVNGHLAFNDPPADFTHPDPLAVVRLDAISRRQQVDDGCFTRLADVPETAITLTIPPLLSASEIFCMVPGAAKRAAVRDTLFGEVTEWVPASALRLHPKCTIHLDEESAPPELQRLR